MSDELIKLYGDLRVEHDRIKRDLEALKQAPVKLAEEAEERIKALEAKVQAITLATTRAHAAPRAEAIKLPGMPARAVPR